VSSSSRKGYNPDNVSLPPRRHELSLQDIANLPRGGDPATDLRDLERLPEARDSRKKKGGRVRKTMENWKTMRFR